MDVVLFATETYQLDGAAGATRPLPGLRRWLLLLHNGVDAAERTAAIVGQHRGWVGRASEAA